MSDYQLEFQFSSQCDPELQPELQQALKDCFSDWPHQCLTKTTTPQPGQKGDPIAIAALVLAIPGGILATWDLVQRLQLKQKLETLIAWAKDKLRRDPKSNISIHLPNGIVLRLDQLSPQQVLDLVTELAKKEQGK